jgi:hypothetical protein
MSQYEIFSKFIEPDYNHDYWSDSASLIALEMIEKFQADDWLEISKSWRNQSSGWQTRLADSLEAAPPDKGFPILSQLILSDNDNLAKTAATTIKGYINQGFPGPLSQEAVDRLKALSKVSKVSAISYADLIKKFDRAASA